MHAADRIKKLHFAFCESFIRIFLSFHFVRRKAEHTVSLRGSIAHFSTLVNRGKIHKPAFFYK